MQNNTTTRDGKYSAQNKYDAANTIQVKLKLNITTDADILEILEKQGNKQGYIKALIRADITQQTGAGNNDRQRYPGKVRGNQ